MKRLVEPYLAQYSIRCAAAAAHVVTCVLSCLLEESGITDELVNQDSQGIGIGYLKSAFYVLEVLSLADA